MRGRRGPGLRVRLTLLATALTAGVSGLLLWLGWLLVGNVVGSAAPSLPPTATVTVAGRRGGRRPVVDGRCATTPGTWCYRPVRSRSCCVVVAAALLAWTLTGRLLRPLQDVTATARRLSAESLGERIALRGPRDEVAAAGRHVRRDAGPVAGHVRGPAPVRRQRQPRAAHAAVGDPHRAGRHPVRPDGGRGRTAPDGRRRGAGRDARRPAGRGAAAAGQDRRHRPGRPRAGRPGRPSSRRRGRRRSPTRTPSA